LEKKFCGKNKVVLFQCLTYTSHLQMNSFLEKKISSEKVHSMVHAKNLMSIDGVRP
jgi:hypothetical protein